MGKSKKRIVAVKYRIRVTRLANNLLKNISDKRVREIIIKRIESLQYEPEKQGKSLVGQLSTLRSISVARHYRIIYKIDNKQITVYIIAVGIRKEKDKKDIYNLLKKLLRFGLIK